MADPQVEILYQFDDKKSIASYDGKYIMITQKKNKKEPKVDLISADAANFMIKRHQQMQAQKQQQGKQQEKVAAGNYFKHQSPTIMHKYLKKYIDKKAEKSKRQRIDKAVQNVHTDKVQVDEAIEKLPESYRDDFLKELRRREGDHYPEKGGSFKFIDKHGEAKSKSQQRLMGMAYAYRKGELDTSDMNKNLLKKVKEVANSMSMEDLKEYAETSHKKNMPEKKASRYFLDFIEKQAYDAFEENLDNKTQQLLAGIDRHNKGVRNQSAQVMGAGTAVGAGAGAAAGGIGQTVYNLVKGKKGLSNVLKNTLKGGLAGGGLAALGTGAYIIPKALKARVTRQEERKLREMLDMSQDRAREQRIRRGAQQLKNYYENK